MSMLSDRDTAETRIELFADELIDIMQHGGKVNENLIRFLMSSYTTMTTFVVRSVKGAGCAVTTFDRFYDSALCVVQLIRDMWDDASYDADAAGAAGVDPERIKKMDLIDAVQYALNNTQVDGQWVDYIVEDCFEKDGSYKSWFYPEKVSEEI